MRDVIRTIVHFFVMDRDCSLFVSRDFLNSNDRPISIADFLAFGNAEIRVLELAEKDGTAIVEMGFIIEKGFQHWRDILVEL
jgi:adenine/guanine phosphoribosyltransferase-like PRPP-binding protein